MLIDARFVGLSSVRSTGNRRLVTAVALLLLIGILRIAKFRPTVSVIARFGSMAIGIMVLGIMDLGIMDLGTVVFRILIL